MIRDQIAEMVFRLPGGRRLWRRYRLLAPYHVISYPKAGRTWLRFVLGEAFVRHFGITTVHPGDLLQPHRLARLDRRVPVIRFSHDDDPHLRRVDPTADKMEYRNKKVVFLARDPRDIVVSSYHQLTQREPGVRFVGSMDEFVADPLHGIENIVAFMNLWAARRTVPRRFLLVRYEDMTEDMESELRRLLAFLDVPSVEDDVISAAVARGRFENMRSLERADALSDAALRPSDPIDPNSYKVRRGEVGGYRNDLSSEVRRYVDGVVRERLDGCFGYERSPTPSDDGPAT